ncbi:MAG: NAD(P)H-hydrate dehydratase [Pseudomonadota bacterium]
MTDLLTAAQMRKLEHAAIESGAVTGLELMERAGVGVVEAMLDEWPELAMVAHRAVVLCGPGNNGGDGFVVARLLKERGWDVEVFLYGDPDTLPPDAKKNHRRWLDIGSVHSFGFPTITDRDEEAFRGATFGKSRTKVLIDALFGIGLNRPLRGLEPVLGCIEPQINFWENRWDWPHLVSIDVPSGLSETGRLGAGNQGFVADLTVTFHAKKKMHALDHGASGKVVVKDIGLDPFILPDKLPPEAPAGSVGTPRRAFAAALAKRSGHKFDHGHALVLSGGPGRTGAARLAARGALRIGAGLVTLGVPPSAQMEVAAQITALMLTRVADAKALEAVFEDARINAVCLGPGLGLGDHAASIVDAVLGGGHLRLTRRVVFDADALTLIAANLSRMAALNENAVLTPHGGEFARLFPDIAERLTAPTTGKGPAYSKVAATRDAAVRSGAVVLFKGSQTVIAHPDGRAARHTAQHERAAPWLATAGAGDVLSGFIAGLLARGFDPFVAAQTATWLHVECARTFGPGLIAEDLPEVLPQVLRDLGA